MATQPVIFRNYRQEVRACIIGGGKGRAGGRSRAHATGSLEMTAPQYRERSVRSRSLRTCLEAVLLSVTVLGLTDCTSMHAPAKGAAIGNIATECAPYARAVSGVELRGAAADWWLQAEGHYDRTQTPALGSVLVFRRSARLPNGHVSVVSGVLSDRRILVTHANWVRHQVSEDVPAIDVSPGNDWTRVRVWWPPTNTLGVTEYATFGFIQANPPSEHDRISAKTRQLSEVAISE